MDDKSTIRRWVVIGLLLRLLVMPFTLHGDIFHVNKYPNFLAHGDWHVYEKAAADGMNYYPPLALIFIAAFQFLEQFLFPPFEEFLRTIAENEYADIWESNHLFLSLFLMKIPYLIIDGMMLTVCWKILQNDADRLTFAIFWAANPLATYIPYMLGQLDMVPAFFTVLACYYCLRKGKENLACLSIAAGCLFKVFPIAFLPLVVLVGGRNLKDYIRLSLVAIIPIILVYGGFYLISGKSVFKIFMDTSYNFDTSQGSQIMVLRIIQAGVYVLVAVHIIFANRREFDYPLLIDYFLLIFLAINGGIVVNFTQYWGWFTPFAVLYMLRQPDQRPLFYILLTLVFLGGMKSRAVGFGIFAPLNHELFLSFPSLQDVTGFLFNQAIYDGVIGMLIKLTLLVMIISILKNLYASTDFTFDWRRLIAR